MVPGACLVNQKSNISRRRWLAVAPAGVGLGLAANTMRSPLSEAVAADARDHAEPFGYCLNTSTIHGQKLSIVEEVAITSRAGYQGIEPWIRELEDHVKAGGNLRDLGKRIADAGLSVESAIGFFDWAVDDEARRGKALEQARREMEMVQQIGGKRIAAPPAGATDRSDMDLLKVAERYRALLDLGDTIGVIPEVEVWGFSKALGRLGEAAFVAIESGHPHACILPDVFHLYKGGSGQGGVRLLSGKAIGIFHFNDYPADPPRAQIDDSRRVYPGDGVAPLKDLVKTLRAIGYRGMLSLELFNPEYWKADALVVARTGLEKMRAVVRASLA